MQGSKSCPTKQSRQRCFKKDFKGTGMSVIEVSASFERGKALWKSVKVYGKSFCIFPMVIKYQVLGGGASMQFLMVPYNLLNKKAAYLETGVWAKKLLKKQKVLAKRKW